MRAATVNRGETVVSEKPVTASADRARPSVPAISLRNIVKRFGNVTAVDDVSLEIAQNEFFSMLGPSGCGKTTLMRMIAGFEKPTSGQILLRGESVERLPSSRRDLNMVFQNYALFPHLSVYANVAFELKVRRMGREQTRRRVTEMLELVELSGMESREPNQLSGGQRQRVALARALVGRPAVLLLDEPLGALDQKLRKGMQVELKRLQREVGITFIYVTHDQEEALTMSDRVAVMRDGRALQVDTPERLYAEPQNTFVAGFIGRSNFLAGTLRSGSAGTVQVDVDGVGALQAPGDLHALGGVGSRITLAVRPERLRIVEHGDAVDAGTVLRGRLRERLFAGDDTEYIVTLADGTDVSLRHQNSGADLGADLSVGDELWLAWSPDSARVLAD